MRSHNAKLTLGILLACLQGCSNEGGTMQGQTGQSQGSAEYSTPGSDAGSNAVPGEDVSGRVGGDLKKSPTDPEVSVTPPQAISGTYLTCPLVGEDDTEIEIGCVYANAETHVKVPDESLFKSVVPKINHSANGMSVTVKKLPASAQWSHLISIVFASEAQKSSLMATLSIDVETLGFDDQVKVVKAAISPLPEEEKNGRRIRNLLTEGGTYLGFYGATDPNVLSDNAMGVYDRIRGVRTRWHLTANRKIKNPLGFCLTEPSFLSDAVLYVECSSSSASTFELRGSQLVITNGAKANQCLMVYAIPNDFFVGPKGPKAIVGLAECDDADASQNWDFPSE